TVYETTLSGFESLGSICSGGRYDALASDGKVTYPGVGISLGVSRLLVPLLQSGYLTASRSVPSCVVVAVNDEAERAASEAVADTLRRRGINTEVAPTAAKFGKQIRHADRRGIPFVWFVGADGEHSVKDIRSGDQVPADPASWTPPPEDLNPRIIQSTPADAVRDEHSNIEHSNIEEHTP
ncbi:MAG TPA: His/Gly/Thr/Pro-type tRNA ligase C-terminal domain-containing protein, partial [Actinomycetes bacterium]|nr:His/Gly/Thr/Pro-type tRNA ligase C-terminal domain-containing protein [Actinomycetes bacterium]